MSQLTLQQLIEEFSLENLTRFFREKNSHFKPVRESLDEYNDETFSKGTKLGETNFSAYEQFILCAFQTGSTLSERSGKKAQYEQARRILKDWQSDAGIFVFYDLAGSFRFSLVYANYQGKKRDWSNFRRFTYFVSPQLTNKTFLQRIGESNFTSLENIKDAFSVEKVTKDFYKEISYWYFWACQKCRFPEGSETEENGRQISVIRLITRLIFVWFMRERGLISKALFDISAINQILIDTSDLSSSYYKAILQNLFFATLNTRINERQFRSNVRGNKGFNPDFNNQYKYRYQDLFSDPGKIQEYFGDIPFLNGGLFECLDEKENGIYVDGFTETKKNQPVVPNELFFSNEKQANFNSELGTTNKAYKVKGFFEILSTYNFTIDENTVDDLDVALDPELLGRVFENLLASFNPETSSTARKATGSYYTPREIVDYMVDESLKAYFKSHLPEMKDLDEKLSSLFSTSQEKNPFDDRISRRIVELVENVRIVDPAVGSGAFPMGALNKLVFILSKVDNGNMLWKKAQLDAADLIPDTQLRSRVKASIENYFQEKNPDYGRKLFLIQKCIYGVDIQQIAVEIAKLRFFISLLVEEKMDKEKENWGIEPLPNLDFKIMQGNSLISDFLGISFEFNTEKPGNLTLDLFENPTDQMIKNLENKKNIYQSESDRDRKLKLRSEIEEILIDIFKNLVKKQRAGYFKELINIEKKYDQIPNNKSREQGIAAEKQKLNEKSSFDLEEAETQLRLFNGKKKLRPFFPWKLYFAEVFNEKNGFDIILTNPPYIGEKGHKEIFREVKKANLRQYYIRKMDYFYFFFHLALDLGNIHAIIAFITTNYYTTATNGVTLRKDLRNRTIITNLIDFNELKIFESALGQHNMITLARKGNNSNALSQTCVTGQRGLCTSGILLSILKGNDEETRYFDLTQDALFDGSDCVIRIEGTTIANNNPIQTALEKIKIKGIPLGTICNINQGILTGVDKITRKHIVENLIGSEFLNCGVFIVNQNELSHLNLSHHEKLIVKPFFKNSDIKKYASKVHPEKYVIYTTRDLDLNLYPKIKKHLERFEKVIRARSEDRGEMQAALKMGKWWVIFAARNTSIFLSEKIICAQRTYNNNFAYNDVQWLASADVYFITKKNSNFLLKYILALLNSKLMYLWFYHKGKRKGEMLELLYTPLTEVPIARMELEHQMPFVELVDKILEHVYSNDYNVDQTKQLKVRQYQEEIDQMVYNLYNLTESEIRCVEKTSVQRKLN